MELPAFHLRHLPMQQQPNLPPGPGEEPQADEQSEVVENTAMWRAAANLTSSEYAYARWIKLRVASGKIPTGLE